MAIMQRDLFQERRCVGFDWATTDRRCFLHYNSTSMVTARVQSPASGRLDQYVRVKCTPGMS